MKSCILVAVLSIAGATRLRAPVDSKLTPDEQQSCLLTDAPKGTFDNSLALVLPDEKEASKFLTDAEKSVDELKEGPTADEKKEWKAAMAEYVKTQTQMKKSQARLMAAMENMLQVPAVDTNKLKKMTDKQEKDDHESQQCRKCGLLDSLNPLNDCCGLLQEGNTTTSGANKVGKLGGFQATTASSSGSVGSTGRRAGMPATAARANLN